MAFTVLYYRFNISVLFVMTHDLRRNQHWHFSPSHRWMIKIKNFLSILNLNIIESLLYYILNFTYILIIHIYDHLPGLQTHTIQNSLIHRWNPCCVSSDASPNLCNFLLLNACRGVSDSAWVTVHNNMLIFSNTRGNLL